VLKSRPIQNEALGTLVAMMRNTISTYPRHTGVGVRYELDLAAAGLTDAWVILRLLCSALYTNFQGGNCLTHVGTEGSAAGLDRDMGGPGCVACCQGVAWFNETAG
jgi:hypothetical protein